MNDNANIKLLYCWNQKWIEQHHDIPTGYEAAYVSTLMSTLTDALLDAGYAVERGTTLYHTWNGAYFTHRFGEIATYSELTAEQAAEVWEIVESVYASVDTQFEIHRLAEQVGTDIGEAIARDVIDNDYSVEWTGLEPRDVDRIPTGLD